MSRPLSRGYALASTDTGHKATGATTRDASYAVGHPEKVTDLAHRAVHEMAVNAKLVITLSPVRLSSIPRNFTLHSFAYR